MSASVLHLRPGSLENPTRMDLAPIEALMLWPCDADARQRMTKSATAEFLATECIHQLSREELIDLVEMIRSTPRLAEIRAQAVGPFSNGARAGAYLREAVGLNMRGELLYVKKLQHQVGEFALPTAGRIGANTFRNVWTDFRAVAHLWAATIHLETAVFPCEVIRLAEFVGLAAGFRELGMQVKGRQSGQGPLLSADTTAEIVSDVPIRVIRPKKPGAC